MSEVENAEPVVPPVTDPSAGEPPPETPAAPVVPEEYADFSVPEGVTLDAVMMEKFAPIAKELRLSQEDAQKLVDLYAADGVARAQEQQAAIIEAASAKWLEDARADKEYGGDKFDASVVLAGKAMTEFATPELKEILDKSGLGNHPEVIRLMVKIGQKMSNDKFIPSASPASAEPKTIAERMFPTASNT